MTRARVLALVLVGGLVALCLLATAQVFGGRHDAGPAPRALESSATTRSLAVLRGWDRARSRAWSADSVRGLRELYVPGSAAGAADVRLLRRYRDRGLRVTGMRTQVLALAVVRREPGRLGLRVTDRVVGAVAVRGRSRTALPRDAASTRVLELRRGGDGRWRVEAVGDAVS